MIETGLVALLKADGTFTSLCGSRIYPLLLPDSPTYPAVTYQTISSVSEYTDDGATGLRTNRLQIDVWGSTYLSVKALSEAIRGVFESYTGTLTDGTYVANIIRDNVTDSYEDQAYLYRVQTDWLVMFDQQ